MPAGSIGSGGSAGRKYKMVEKYSRSYGTNTVVNVKQIKFRLRKQIQLEVGGGSADGKPWEWCTSVSHGSHDLTRSQYSRRYLPPYDNKY